MADLCSVCEKNAAVSRCGDCKERLYCSEKCQLFDWDMKGHRESCHPIDQIGAALSPFEGSKKKNKHFGIYSEMIVSVIRTNGKFFKNPLQAVKFRQYFPGVSEIDKKQTLPQILLEYKVPGDETTERVRNPDKDYYLAKLPRGQIVYQGSVFDYAQTSDGVAKATVEGFVIYTFQRRIPTYILFDRPGFFGFDVKEIELWRTAQTLDNLWAWFVSIRKVTADKNLAVRSRQLVPTYPAFLAYGDADKIYDEGVQLFKDDPTNKERDPTKPKSKNPSKTSKKQQDAQQGSSTGQPNQSATPNGTNVIQTAPGTTIIVQEAKTPAVSRTSSTRSVAPPATVDVKEGEESGSESNE